MSETAASVAATQQGMRAAARLLDEAKKVGYGFQRAGDGFDAPLHATRESVEFIDRIWINGVTGSCSASRKRRSSLIIPGEAVTKTVEGDALTVLHTAVYDWLV